MLILPMENTFSIRKLPIVTWLLIAVNSIIFFTYSINDDDIFIQATENYVEKGILNYELPLYQSWLQTQEEFESPFLEAEKAEDLNPQEQFAFAFEILINTQYQIDSAPELMEYFDENIELIEQREKIINEEVSQISSRKFGLIPAEPLSIGLISHQFMHGGFMHLLGNMVILLLVGMTVEQLLGSFNYILFYLLAGLMGGITYCLVHGGSYISLVGASGAISGVMGMYVAAYGMKKIRFFYWIAFVFNYFRASALLILPIWIGKELFDYFFTDSNVAYSAHAGGMVVGALLVFIGKISWLKVDEDILENKDEDLEFRKKIQLAYQSISNADFDSARTQLWRLQKQYPNDPRVLDQLVQLESQRPNGKPFHLANIQYLTQALRDGRLDESEIKIFTTYWQVAKPRPMIKNTLLNKVLHKLIAAKQMDLVEKVFKEAADYKLLDKSNRYQILQTLIQFYRGKNPDKAHYYQQQAEQG